VCEPSFVSPNPAAKTLSLGNAKVTSARVTVNGQCTFPDSSQFSAKGLVTPEQWLNHPWLSTFWPARRPSVVR
jgi:hypothetical protein